MKSSAMLVSGFCLLTVSLVPPASKEAMRHTQSAAQPLALATSQLLLSALVFLAVSFVLGGGSLRGVFGSFLEAAPVGAAFGAKLALMNLGLSGSSTIAHLALQSTDLVWCAAFARCFTPTEAAKTALGKVSLLGCVFGASLVALGKNKSKSPGTLLSLMANLMAPAFQGLCIVLLRGYVARAVIKRPHSSVAQTVVDFTAAKLIVSAMTAALLACLPLLFLRIHHSDPISEDMAPLFVFFETRQDFFFVCLASGLVACVQLSFTALAAVMSANSIGVVGTVKILPQVLIAALVNAAKGHWRLQAAFQDIDDIQLLGTFLLLASALLWANSKEKKTIISNPRDVLVV